MDLLLSCHRAPFNHHSTGLKAKWMINPRTDHVMDMRGRGCKAMSGNCCNASSITWRKATHPNPFSPLSEPPPLSHRLIHPTQCRSLQIYLMGTWLPGHRG